MFNASINREWTTDTKQTMFRDTQTGQTTDNYEVPSVFMTKFKECLTAMLLWRLWPWAKSSGLGLWPESSRCLYSTLSPNNPARITCTYLDNIMLFYNNKVIVVLDDSWGWVEGAAGSSISAREQDGWSSQSPVSNHGNNRIDQQQAEYFKSNL